MKIISPGDLELRYLRRERGIINFLTTHFFQSSLLLFICLVGLGWFSSLLLNNGRNYLLINGFKNFYFFSYSIYLVAALSFVSVFVPKKYNNKFQFFSTCVMWGVLASFIFVTVENALKNFEIAFFFPWLLIGSFLYLYFSNKFGTQKIITLIYGIFFWSSYLFIFFHRASLSRESLGFFWEFKLPFLWIFISTIPYYFKKNKTYNAELLFNPIQISRGMIWPSSIEWNLEGSEKKKLWIHGANSVLLALLVLSLKMIIENCIKLIELDIFYRTTLVQLLRIFTDIGICNLITGMARMFGYRVPDATSFVLLAKTPAEYWRRGSVYTYQFVFRTIFLPVFNLVKNRYVAVFVAFLFFYSNRIGLERFGVNFTQFNGDIDEGLKIDSLIFLGYYFNIIVTQKYWFFNRERMQQPLYAWMSVILTHSLNIGMIIGARMLVRMI